MLEVVARIVLSQSRDVIQNFSGWQNCFEADAVGMQGIVADEVDSTGIGGEVSADLTRTFGAEVERHGIPDFMQIILHILQNSARLGGDDPVRLVKIQDLVHISHAQNDLIKDGVGASDQPSVAALWDESQLLLIAVFKNGSYLFIGFGLEHQFTLPDELLGPVSVRSLNLVGICDHAALVKYLLKKREVRITKYFEVFVALNVDLRTE